MRELRDIEFEGKEITRVALWDGIVSDVREDGEDLVLMQYTGLKDKNGKEMYEGDVVKCAELSPKDMPLIQRVGYIEYADNTCTFGVWTHWNQFGSDSEDDAKALWPIGNFRLSEFEIMGNIYENPDLLTE